MAEKKPIGQLIDSLGVVGDLEAGDLVDSAYVILKYVSDDGKVWIQSAWPDGLDIFNRIGLLESALFLEKMRFMGDEDED